MPKNCQVYFMAVILILKTRQEHGEVSITLIADQQQSKVQDALPSIYSWSIAKLLYFYFVI